VTDLTVGLPNLNHDDFGHYARDLVHGTISHNRSMRSTAAFAQAMMAVIADA
jgi:hypothetical protein